MKRYLAAFFMLLMLVGVGACQPEYVQITDPPEPAVPLGPLDIKSVDKRYAGAHKEIIITILTRTHTLTPVRRIGIDVTLASSGLGAGMTTNGIPANQTRWHEPNGETSIGGNWSIPISSEVTTKIEWTITASASRGSGSGSFLPGDVLSCIITDGTGKVLDSNEATIGNDQGTKARVACSYES